MRRREFIALVGGAAAATTGWPPASPAQQLGMPVIGYLSAGSAEGFATRLAAFRQGLNESGYVEGRNVAIEYCWADGHNDRLPGLAADLVRRRVAVIAALGGVPGALAAKAATTTIPIVFEIGPDPVASGLAASLNRPGGNITGVTSLNVQVGPKRLELLRQLAPTATTMAVLVNPTNTNADTVATEAQTVARSLGLQTHILHASTEHDIDKAFASLVQLRAGGLVVSPDPFFISRSEQLGALTVRHAVVAIFHSREFAVAGGLMSYGGSVAESHRQAGIYTGRILNGDTPTNLPIQQVTKVELIINLKTAKALGLTIPSALLARADEIIE